METHKTVNIRKISKNRAEQVGYYRFLQNENVTIGELSSGLGNSCALNADGKHILAISDTSEINLQSHLGRLKTVLVQADSRIERKAREALLAVRCARVEIQRPHKLSAKNYPD
ncbi:MAG: hypothetical protein ACKPA7_08120, partial [Sphaerospermopsis kisseleviana]